MDKEDFFGYYGSFLELLDQENVLRIEKDKKAKTDLSLLTDSRCRNYLLSSDLDKLKLIPLFSQVLRKRICKPQRLIQDHELFYVANDLATSTYYICYKNVLMIDIDLYKDLISVPKKSEDKLLEDPSGTVPGKIPEKPREQPEKDPKKELEIQLAIIRDYCKINRSLHFLVYRSQGGLHLFEVSQPWNCRSDEAMKVMLDLNCDFYYIVYSYLRGWSVRLNRKLREERTGKEEEDKVSSENIEKKEKKSLYSFLGEIGHGQKDPQQERLVLLHIELTGSFSDVIPSQMYGGKMP